MLPEAFHLTRESPISPMRLFASGKFARRGILPGKWGENWQNCLNFPGFYCKSTPEVLC